MKRFFTLLLAASCLTAVGQVPDYVPTNGLVAWFDFGFGQEDQSGNLELILNGGAQLADGVLDVSQSGAWAESNELPPSLEGAPAFSVVAVLQSQMSHYDAASWGIGGGSTTQNINSWNHSSGEAANQVTVDLWGGTTFGSGLEYSQEEFDVALWTKTAGNFSAGNILLGLNDQIVGGPDLAALRNGLDLPALPEGGKLYLGKAGLEDNYYGPFKIKIFGLFDRALDVEEYLLLRFNMMEELGGCTDISACNYSPEAFFDDGSCESFGCMDSHACNFSGEAACDDGSCDYSCCPGPGCCDVGTEWSWASNTCVVANPSDSNFDGCVQLNDLLDLLSAYGDCGAEESAWQCGDPLEYQDYDYETVQIGEQCWFAENLRTEKFVNGDSITTGLSDVEWQGCFDPEYCNEIPGIGPSYSVYGAAEYCQSSNQNVNACDIEMSEEEFGFLYNWYAVNDERMLCPSGWKVSSDDDWMILESFLGMAQDELVLTGYRGTDQGIQLKATTGWNFGFNGTNSSGFESRPGGMRDNAGADVESGSNARFWTTTIHQLNPNTGQVGGVWTRILSDSREQENDGSVSRSSAGPAYGFSVRCIKD